MKKLIGIALVLALMASLGFSSIALADGPPDPPSQDPEDGVVKVFMDGNDYSFDIETWTNDAYDRFSGEAHSSLWMTQTVRYQPSGAWTYDAPDIDRWAGFEGEGRLEVKWDFDSQVAWQGGASHMEAGLEVTGGSSGFLCQQLHYDAHKSGVGCEVDQWKKQRDMWMHADGDYDMWLSCYDVTGTNPYYGSEGEDYGFGFFASDDSSSGDFFADSMYTTTAHNSYDTLTVDFGFHWEGDPGIVMGSYANRGGDIDWQIDLINDFVGGQGTIY